MQTKTKTPKTVKKTKATKKSKAVATPTVVVKSKEKGMKNPSRKAIKRLVSPHIVERMKTALNKIASFEEARTTYRILLTEERMTGINTGWTIMTVDKPSTAVKTVFFNLETEQWRLFTEADKPGYGNHCIIWPK